MLYCSDGHPHLILYTRLLNCAVLLLSNMTLAPLFSESSGSFSCTPTCAQLYGLSLSLFFPFVLLTHPLNVQLFPSLLQFIHPRDRISLFLNRSEASISAIAQVFCIGSSFRLGNRSVRGWGPIFLAIVLARVFALVCLICRSLLPLLYRCFIQDIKCGNRPE